jgi:hypothetical protein
MIMKRKPYRLARDASFGGRRAALAAVSSTLAALAGVGVAAAADEADSNALTIYSTATPGAIPPELYRPSMQSGAYSPVQYVRMIPGYAVVKQERAVTLDERRSTVRFTDVAAQIDPTTVSFASLTDPEGTHVLEQNYEFDLVSADKLMRRYLDRDITVWQTRGDKPYRYDGTLLGTLGGLTMKGADGGVQILSGYSSVEFPELPGGLISKPTLVWDLLTESPGTHRVRVTYETKAMTWWADYNVVFAEGEDANSGLLDIGAWVSIINQSGAGYPDARLKLIAGDVHRAPRPRAMQYGVERLGRKAGAQMAAEGFEEKAFFEYHLYTLGRPTTLPDNSTKQIELFPTARGVPCEKVLVYYGLAQGFRGFYPNPMTDRNFGTQSNKKIDIYLRFQNRKEDQLGIPLPSGRIRVSKLDPADDTLEFIGEDKIDHTPKDEKVLIKLGSAFDVVGERKQIDYKYDSRRDWMEETIEIKIRNHKDEPVKVIVKENLYRWVNWQIGQKTYDYEKQDARTIHFPVRVPKDGEVTVRYTVKYTW